MPTRSFTRCCRQRVRQLLTLGCFSLLGAALGCAATWDEVWSRKIREKPLETLFVTPDPIQVLRESPDGDEIAKALRHLREPAREGNKELQEEVIQLLHKFAVSDNRPLCRLAAIDCLSRFEDPRVSGILVAAYRSASPAKSADDETSDLQPAGATAPRKLSLLPPEAPTVQQETLTTLQSRILVALGQHPSPEGLSLLLEVVNTPEKKTDSEMAIQHRRDLRLAAIRSLKTYPDSKTVAALVKVLQTEKDVSLRDRAHETLVAVTGRDLPAEGKGWEAALEPGFPLKPESPSMLRRVGQWFSH